MPDEFFRPQVREGVEYRELDDGAVVYDTSAERIHTLNLSAAYIWNCCDGEHNLSDIAAELNLQVHVAMDVAIRHVHDAVAYFQSEGLLRPQ